MRETPRTARHEPDEALELADVPRREVRRLAASLLAPRRRAVLATVRSAGALPLSELAVRVAARERGVPPGDVTPDRYNRVHVSLRHAHVPKLVDAGVLERDREGDLTIVRPTASVRDGDWTEAVEAAVRIDESGEAVATLLAEPRRVRVLSLLREAGPLPLEDVARAVAEAEAADDEPTEGDVTSVAVSLHHSHLPKLAAVGVLEYDSEERRAAVADVPEAFGRARDDSAAVSGEGGTRDRRPRQ